MPANRRTPSRGSRPGRNRRRIPASTPRTRPGGRATARAASAPVPRARPRFTNRMAVLVVVFAVLVISYASSMRAYLQQHQHINDLKAHIASSERQIGELKQEKRRWRDPAYVEQQARARFGWVLPGETAYNVIGKDGKPLGGTDQLSAPRARVTRPEAWWSTAYATFEAADHPPRHAAKPTPQTLIVPPARGR